MKSGLRLLPCTTTTPAVHAPCRTVDPRVRATRSNICSARLTTSGVSSDALHYTHVKVRQQWPLGQPHQCIGTSCCCYGVDYLKWIPTSKVCCCRAIPALQDPNREEWTSLRSVPSSSEFTNPPRLYHSSLIEPSQATAALAKGSLEVWAQE